MVAESDDVLFNALTTEAQVDESVTKETLRGR